MTDVRFYHLTRSRLEDALPVMLERTLARDQRAVVVLDDEQRRDALNAALWTYRDDSFLPHGTVKEGSAEDQPIWLTDELERPNGASYVFYADGALPRPEQLGEGVEVCAILFDGRNEQLVQQARVCWSALKKAGLKLTYWSQQERGWQQAASANDDDANKSGGSSS